MALFGVVGDDPPNQLIPTIQPTIDTTWLYTQGFAFRDSIGFNSVALGGTLQSFPTAGTGQFVLVRSVEVAAASEVGMTELGISVGINFDSQGVVIVESRRFTGAALAVAAGANIFRCPWEPQDTLLAPSGAAAAPGLIITAHVDELVGVPNVDLLLRVQYVRLPP